MNDTILVTLAITTLVICISFPLLFNHKRKVLSDKLSSLLLKKDYASFDVMSESKEAKRYIHPFNLSVLKLNSAFMRNDSGMIKSNIDSLTQMDLNSKQKQIVFENAFYYYVSTKQLTEAQECYDILRSIPNINLHNVERSYDTFVLNGYQYLDETLSLLSRLPDNQKPPVESLLIAMYTNKGDKKNAEKYKKLLDEHLKS